MRESAGRDVAISVSLPGIIEPHSPSSSSDDGHSSYASAAEFPSEGGGHAMSLHLDFADLGVEPPRGAGPEQGRMTVISHV